MDRLNCWQGEEPIPLVPGGKFGDRPGVRLACVRVPNVGGEEGDKPFGRLGRWREERRQAASRPAILKRSFIATRRVVTCFSPVLDSDAVSPSSAISSLGTDDAVF